MARFAPVVPLQIARVLQENVHTNLDGPAKSDYLGGYHLLLAHDVINQPTGYQEVYGLVRRRYKDQSFIILDNSIIELGKAMEIQDLLNAANILKPDCIVIPDVMGDGLATRNKAINFVREYVQEVVKIEATNPRYVAPALMGVLQGDDVNDVIDTLGVFYGLPLVDYIGIPRVLTKMHGSRMPTLMALQRSPALAGRSFKGFHLLGFSDDILDDVSCARVEWIQGIDSAVPIRAAKKGLVVSLEGNGINWSAAVGPRGDFWEQVLSESDLNIARCNLDIYRGWIQSAANSRSRLAA